MNYRIGFPYAEPSNQYRKTIMLVSSSDTKNFRSVSYRETRIALPDLKEFRFLNKMRNGIDGRILDEEDNNKQGIVCDGTIHAMGRSSQLATALAAYSPHKGDGPLIMFSGAICFNGEEGDLSVALISRYIESKDEEVLLAKDLIKKYETCRLFNAVAYVVPSADADILHKQHGIPISKIEDIRFYSAYSSPMLVGVGEDDFEKLAILVGVPKKRYQIKKYNSGYPTTFFLSFLVLLFALLTFYFAFFKNNSNVDWEKIEEYYQKIAEKDVNAEINNVRTQAKEDLLENLKNNFSQEFSYLLDEISILDKSPLEIAKMASLLGMAHLIEKISNNKKNSYNFQNLFSDITILKNVEKSSDINKFRIKLVQALTNKNFSSPEIKSYVSCLIGISLCISALRGENKHLIEISLPFFSETEKKNNFILSSKFFAFNQLASMEQKNGNYEQCLKYYEQALNTINQTASTMPSYNTYRFYNNYSHCLVSLSHLLKKSSSKIKDKIYSLLKKEILDKKNRSDLKQELINKEIINKEINTLVDTYLKEAIYISKLVGGNKPELGLNVFRAKVIFKNINLTNVYVVDILQASVVTWIKRGYSKKQVVNFLSQDPVVQMLDKTSELYLLYKQKILNK